MLWKATCMKLTLRLQVTETHSQNDITTTEYIVDYFENVGTPGRIRTPDPLVRSEMLCPAELRAHKWGERRDSNPRSSGPQPDVLTNYTTPTI